MLFDSDSPDSPQHVGQTPKLSSRDGENRSQQERDSDVYEEEFGKDEDSPC